MFSCSSLRSIGVRRSTWITQLGNESKPIILKLALAFAREQRYSHRMPKKPLLFPQPKTPEPPVPGATQGQRVIVSMGSSQRFAIDFYRKITQLNAEPAPVVPIERRKGRKRSSSRK
jgi:hypothetical protein